jgi:hypothetical protein
MTLKIKGIECRFAVYLPGQEFGGDDLHLIKEQITYEDGSKCPNIRFVKNFKRPFWITKEAYRDHQSKKEWESVDKLQKYECTQSQLRNQVAKALGSQYMKGSLRELCSSPYVYGSDVLSTAYIKKAYKDKYPNVETSFSIATLDIESNVKDRSIVLITIAFEKKIYTSIYQPFVNGITNLQQKIDEKVKQYLSDYINPQEYQLEAEVFNSQYEVINNVFKKLHEWKPDFVAIWNINYDIPEIIYNLQKAGIPLENVFNDPSVPKEFRYFKYKVGKSQKVTASGDMSPIKPASQWHTVISPSSFYLVDAMCAYKHNRIGKPDEPSYSLNNILNKELGIRKLSFREADGLDGLSWHEFMRTQYPVEYIVYNIFDSVSMLELDKKTKDLSLTLPLFSGVSDFENYNSQPKRSADKIHYYCHEKELVIGSTGKNMVEELDEKILSLKGWIVNLRADLVLDNGLQCIIEDPNLHTNIRIHVADLDISGAYPSTQVASNVSKETTCREVISISKVDSYLSRMENINLFSGHVNALEYCQAMFNFPRLDNLLEAYQNTKSIT